MAESDPFDLARFVAAQDAGGTYEAALRELRAGRKRSHWMWFVFPQLAGLGRSATAQHFALTSSDEAAAYLAHPVLGPRLLTCGRAVLDSPATSADELFGPVDAQKLRSSATLFALAAADPEQRQVFAAVLDRYYGGEHDAATLRLLRQPG